MQSGYLRLSLRKGGCNSNFIFFLDLAIEVPPFFSAKRVTNGVFEAILMVWSAASGLGK